MAESHAPIEGERWHCSLTKSFQSTWREASPNETAAFYRTSNRVSSNRAPLSPEGVALQATLAKANIVAEASAPTRLTAAANVQIHHGLSRFHQEFAEMFTKIHCFIMISRRFDYVCLFQLFCYRGKKVCCSFARRSFHHWPVNILLARVVF